MSDTRIVDGPVETPSIGRRWLERGLLAGVLLAGAVALSSNLADADLWGHVQYGRDLLRDGLPATTTYSFTASGYRWINHENLAEILLALGADTVGARGLLVAKCLLGLAVLGLVLRHSLRRGVSPVVICLVCLLLAINLTAHWTLRPQLLSYTCYALMLALLAWCFQGWEGRWHLPWFDGRGWRSPEPLVYSAQRLRGLWLAAPLMLIWANSHGGFVAGYAIFCGYLLLRAAEAWASRGSAARGLVLRLLLMIVVSGLATLINPYGPGLHGWLLRSLSVPRPEITEWHPPDWSSPTSVPLILLLVVGTAALALSRRTRDFTHLVLLSLILWQTLRHARHAPFLALALGFWLPVHLESLLDRLRISRKDVSYGEGGSGPFRWVLAMGMCLAYAILGWQLAQRLREIPVPRDEYPVAAVQYMADQKLGGKLVVTYNWAQYLIAALGQTGQDLPVVQVAFDGRFRTCYPQEIVDMHFDLVLGSGEPEKRFRGPDSGPPDPTRVLRHGQPDLVLINRFQPHSEQVMRTQQQEWVLLYQDRIAQLWGRRSVYDRPDLPAYVEPARRSVSDAVEQGSVRWPAVPTPAVPAPAVPALAVRALAGDPPAGVPTDARLAAERPVAPAVGPSRSALAAIDLFHQTLRGLLNLQRGH